MARSFLNFIMMLSCVLPAGTALARTRAKEKEPVKQVAPVAPVNYDDPNMAYTPDYATDSAVSCPKTLKGARLRKCLLKNGLAASEEISGDPEVLANDSSSSFH